MFVSYRISLCEHQREMNRLSTHMLQIRSSAPLYGNRYIYNILLETLAMLSEWGNFCLYVKLFSTSSEVPL